MDNIKGSSLGSLMEIVPEEVAGYEKGSSDSLMGKYRIFEAAFQRLRRNRFYDHEAN